MRKNPKLLYSISTIILIISSLSMFTSVAGSIQFTDTYIIPAESWFFILENENLTQNTVYNFEWSSDDTIQGVSLSESDFLEMQSLSSLERSTYFEGLTYTEGIADTGIITSNENGEVFFVFFNPSGSSICLTLIINAKEGLSPALMGIIISFVTVIFLGLVSFLTIKIRQKMIKEAEEEEEMTPQQRYMQM